MPKNVTSTPVHNKKDVVFISSSMFSNLSATKLTTEQINAHVFFYRGADSYQMMDKLRRDENVQNLAKQKSVSKVFILTGSNNVDRIWTNKQSLNDGYSSIAQTID